MIGSEAPPLEVVEYFSTKINVGLLQARVIEQNFSEGLHGIQQEESWL